MSGTAVHSVIVTTVGFRIYAPVGSRRQFPQLSRLVVNGFQAPFPLRLLVDSTAVRQQRSTADCALSCGCPFKPVNRIIRFGLTVATCA
jgi:hypothetical protein